MTKKPCEFQHTAIDCSIRNLYSEPYVEDSIGLPYYQNYSLCVSYKTIGETGATQPYMDDELYIFECYATKTNLASPLSWTKSTSRLFKYIMLLKP